jgi:diguanylate cyclase (GGDEF)-like protein
MTRALIESVADTTSYRDRDSVHRAVAHMILDHLNADSVGIYKLIEDDGVMRLASHVGVLRGGRELAPDAVDVLSKLPALGNLPEWGESVRQHELVQFTQADGMTCTILPIEADRDVIGLLAVKSPSRLAPRDVQLVAAILRILKNHLALLDYGERDTLTGMLNRKTFEKRFEKLRQRLVALDAAHTTKEPSWLGLVDIDKFKLINDSHGHLFGDEVLLLISQLMQRCFRGADHLFRFGGEEFVIVLDNATELGAQIAFERLRAAVAEFNFPQVGRVTISLGYTQILPPDAPTACVERADAALYYAKNHGRNNIRNYEALVAAGELTAKDQCEEAELF